MSADQDVDMSTLTPEEQAVLTEDEFSPEELAAMQAVIDGQDGTGHDDDDEAAAAADAPAAAEPAAEQEPAAAPAAAPDAPAATSKPIHAEQQNFAPQYVADLPADFAAREAAIKSKTQELSDQFRNGEIDFDAYRTESESLTSERDVLLLARAKAEISTEMREQSTEQQWAHTVQAFKATVKTTAGVDYDTDAVRGSDLDTVVRTLANNPANAQRSMDWFLNEAHRVVSAMHGNPVPAKAATGAAKTVASRAPSLADQPKTLAQVHGGSGPGDVGSAFAGVDGLDGDALEAAIARMTDAQREQYLAGV
jgi:hypothetical protein